MIATALALQEVVGRTLYANDVADEAGSLAMDYQSLSLDEFIGRLYHYTALVSRLATTFATTALLSEDQQDELLDTITEMELLSASVIDNPEPLD